MQKKRLLLHICCAPDATVVVERLRNEYEITGYFYNPNIHPEEEYKLRAKEMERLALKMEFPVTFGLYDADRWFSLTSGMQDMPEGSRRCEICIRMRLENAARFAAESNFDLFTTVLTVSPHKNADLVNSLGDNFEKEFQIEFLAGNFKKKDGFKRSIELSKFYHLYRQNYCGCMYSKR